MTFLDDYSAGKSSHLLNEGANQGANFHKPNGNSDKLLENKELSGKFGWITAKEGANLLSITERAIQKHCRLGHFDARKTKMNGGWGYEISVSSILKYLESRGKTAKRLEILAKLGVMNVEVTTREGAERKNITKKALARYDVIKLYEEFVKSAGGKKLRAKEDFVIAYNAGAYQEAFGILGKIGSWKTIERWRKTLAESQGDPSALEDNYKPKKAGITAAETEILLALFLHPNMLPVSEIIRTARARLQAEGVAVKSEAAYRRFLEKWKRENYDLYAMTRQGKKAYNDRVQPWIARDYDKIEVADIVVADGHTFNFEAINPATGKPKRMTLVLFYDMKSSMPLGFEIMPTENTLAIASALRKTILKLGFIPRIAYLDNGRAFRGKYFTGTRNFATSGLSGLFERLGMKAIFATPYHGQSKTVERFFGILGEFERRFSSYVGNSVCNQPARLMRNEKLHRRFFAETYPTVWDVAANLTEFFKEYAIRPHQGGFYKGRTPAEVFAESIERVKTFPDFEKRILNDPAELDYLMMEETMRAVGNNGVRLFGKYFFNEALLSISGEVTVKYDLLDLSSVLIFRNGEYLCKADDGISDRVHPAAELLGTDEDRAQLTARLAEKNRYKKAIEKEAKNVFEIIDAHTHIYKVEAEEKAELEAKVDAKRLESSDEDYWEMWNEANEL